MILFMEYILCSYEQISKKVILKSVHFKKTVARFSFLSKLWYFSTDFVLMSADVVLKSTTILKEMRIAQLSS